MSDLLKIDSDIIGLSMSNLVHFVYIADIAINGDDGSVNLSNRVMSRSISDKTVTRMLHGSSIDFNGMCLPPLFDIELHESLTLVDVKSSMARVDKAVEYIDIGRHGYYLVLIWVQTNENKWVSYSRNITSTCLNIIANDVQTMELTSSSPLEL